MLTEKCQEMFVSPQSAFGVPEVNKVRAKSNTTVVNTDTSSNIAKQRGKKNK